MGTLWVLKNLDIGAKETTTVLSSNKGKVSMLEAGVINQVTHVLEGNGKDKNTFGLTEAEIQDISTCITEGEPVYNTFAYRKFLQAILPNGQKVPDIKGNLKFSLDIPEYEIVQQGEKQKIILMNYVGAQFILKKLSILLGKSVGFPTADIFYASASKCGYYSGKRTTHGKLYHFQGCIYGWTHGVQSRKAAPYSLYMSNGTRESGKIGCNNGFSLFPTAEE